MKLEIVIDSRSDDNWIALLKDGKLIELHEDRGGTDFSVGDIYLGKVRRVVPSLNAAFVDVGYEKDAFLHYLDLGPQYNSFALFCKKGRSLKCCLLLNPFSFKLLKSLFRLRGQGFVLKLPLQDAIWSSFLFRIKFQSPKK